jgi:myo-inositol-1(or 4)-monophosphatase
MVAAGEIDVYWDAGCYSWDVAVSPPACSHPRLGGPGLELKIQAGAVIVPEAGGLFSGGKDAFKRGIQPGDAIMSRRYVFMRAVQGTAVSPMTFPYIWRNSSGRPRSPRRSNVALSPRCTTP